MAGEDVESRFVIFFARCCLGKVVRVVLSDSLSHSEAALLHLFLWLFAGHSCASALAQLGLESRIHVHFVILYFPRHGFFEVRTKKSNRTKDSSWLHWKLKFSLGNVVFQDSDALATGPGALFYLLLAEVAVGAVGRSRIKLRILKV